MQITLAVPDDYTLPDTLVNAPPEVVAKVLTIASLVPDFLQTTSESRDTQEQIVSAIKKYGTDTVGDLQKKVARSEMENESLRAKILSVQGCALQEAQQKVGKEMKKTELRLQEALERQCTILQEHKTETTTIQRELTEARARVAELTTPTGLGRSGEMDVACILQEAGYDVEDTSKVATGALDLRVYSKEYGVSLAIEVKNKHPIQAVDLRDFDAKSESMISTGSVHGTLFLSIRSHTKKDNDILKVMMDSCGRPVGCIGWVGTERAKNASPLTREQIETVVQVHMAMIKECSVITKNMGDTKDADVAIVQEYVGNCVSRMYTIFDRLSKQAKLIEEQRQNLTETRVELIQAFHGVHQMNSKIQWLGQDASIPWMESFQQGLGLIQTMKESEVWNRMSRQKTVIERTIGKDAFMESLRRHKRPRDHQEEVTE